MMFFVHPQIQFNINNLKKVFLSFFKKPDLDFIEKKLNVYFPNKKFIFTDMGRTAFKLVVEKLKLQNSEIIFPAYICDIFYPILKRYNIKPIFIDIELDSFNIDIDKVLSERTENTKAVLISHTYGLPVNLEKLKDLIVIEDCAHLFGSKQVGKLGAVAFFSLYKQFPSLRGGLLICPKDWEIKLPKTKFNFRDFISLLNSFPFFAYIFKLFGSKTPSITESFIRKEKMLKPAGINSVSLNLFSRHLDSFEVLLEKRKELALFLQQELKSLGFKVQNSENNMFCYVSVLMPERLREKRDQLVKRLRKEKVFCTRIWHTPIILNPEVQKEYNINSIEFPNSIEAAKRIINFPLQNHYTEKDIKKIIKALEKTLKKL